MIAAAWWALAWVGSATAAAQVPEPGYAVVASPADFTDEDVPQTPLDELLWQVEADRMLLAELRKPVPMNRQEAEAYLARMKEMALRSDPVRLSLLVNKVIEQAPYYFDWIEAEFENPDQRAIEYYLGGASGFHAALEEFERGVLLTVINRLTLLSDLIQESGIEVSGP